MRMFIPNAAGPTNLGDVAITTSLIEQLKKAGQTIHLHTFDPQTAAYPGISVGKNIYYWIAFEPKSKKVKLWRLGQLLSFLLLPQLRIFLSKELQTMLADYKEADKVILAGGGYFRSRQGFTQQLNALMMGSYILIAKRFHKPVRIRPMSFGPFANKLVEKICAHMISLADDIAIRDAVSYTLLSRYIAKNRLKRRNDDAFLLQHARVRKYKRRTLGFTVKHEPPYTHDPDVLQRLAAFIATTATQKNCTTLQPIIQSSGDDYGEGDLQLTKKIISLLKVYNLTVKKVAQPNTVSQALTNYGKLHYLVGMRMHSCIFAQIQKVPFTAISYEHKHVLLEENADQIIPIIDFVLPPPRIITRAQKEKDSLSESWGSIRKVFNS